MATHPSHPSSSIALPASARRSFRTSLSLYIILSIFGLPILALMLVVGIKSGDWSPFLVGLPLLAAIYALLAWLRFDIDPDGFTYRGPLGTVRIPFSDIAIARFETERGSHSPQGAAFFHVQLRSGRTVNTRIRCFPVEAAGWLLTALDLHQIPIEEPATWSAKRMYRQMRDAQQKIASQALS